MQVNNCIDQTFSIVFISECMTFERVDKMRWCPNIAGQQTRNSLRVILWRGFPFNILFCLLFVQNGLHCPLRMVKITIHILYFYLAQLNCGISICFCSILTTPSNVLSFFVSLTWSDCLYCNNGIHCSFALQYFRQTRWTLAFFFDTLKHNDSDIRTTVIYLRSR